MQQIFDFPITKVHSFRNFICCDGNAAGFQFACRIADPQDPENLLYLHGPPGSGKTHLLKALCAALPGDPRYLSLAGQRDPDRLIGAADGATAILLDDLHLLGDDPELRAAVWQVFNDFHDAGKVTVLAGRPAPRDLPHLDEHLVSRLLWGLVAKVDTSDDASRRMILGKVADECQVRVPDEVIEYLLMTTGREVSELIESFETLYRLSVAEKRRITLPLARECRERHHGDTP